MVNREIRDEKTPYARPKCFCCISDCCVWSAKLNIKMRPDRSEVLFCTSGFWSWRNDSNSFSQIHNSSNSSEYWIAVPFSRRSRPPFSNPPGIFLEIFLTQAPGRQHTSLWVWSDWHIGPSVPLRRSHLWLSPSFLFWRRQSLSVELTSSP